MNSSNILTRKSLYYWAAKTYCKISPSLSYSFPVIVLSNKAFLTGQVSHLTNVVARLLGACLLPSTPWIHFMSISAVMDNKAINLGDAAARGYGMRHLQAFLMAVMSFLAYSLRVNLSVAIVAMTGMDTSNNNGTVTESIYPVYAWDADIQGLVLSSFFWGYVSTQIPAGILTERYGGHRFLCFAIFTSSALTILLPPCAFYGGWQLVCANRMLQGVFQGFTYPSVFTLLGLWAPPEERGRLSGIVMGAQLLGTVAATPVAGYLTSFSGWPSVFYWFGAVGVASSLVVVYFGADSPAQHRFISAEERNFIEHSLGGAKGQTKIPWRLMLTSVPVWCAVLTMAFQGGVFMTFLTKIPTYLGTVLKFNIEDNGLVSALPYFVSWITTYAFSWVCDFVTNKRWITLTTARKISNSIAHLGCASCMLLMGFSKSTTLSVFLLTMSMGSIGAAYPGVQANFVDLAPNYSGTLYSIANLLAAGLSVLGPIIFGWIVTEPGSAEQWRTVFISAAAVMLASNLIFVIFGTAETQRWNWYEPRKTLRLGARERKNDRINVT